ncbi:MAG: AraC family transcriptional regulator [Pseudomonadota bacterium]
MYRRDHGSDDGFRFDGAGWMLVARPPGACRITVPAGRHFLDVHLGKSAGSYELSGHEDLGCDAPASTFVFLPAGREREIAASRSGWGVQLAFMPALLPPIAPGEPGPDFRPRLVWHGEDDAMIVIAQQLCGLWEASMAPPTADQVGSVATILMMRVAHHMVGRPERLTQPSSVSRRVQTVLDHIEDHRADPLSIEDLASVAGVSTYHFARLFRRATGRTPHQYVVARRLAHAKRRLHLSDDPIVAIAQDCGFGSQSHMTGVFSKVLGTTPGAIRRRSQ